MHCLCYGSKTLWWTQSSLHPFSPFYCLFHTYWCSYGCAVVLRKGFILKRRYIVCFHRLMGNLKFWKQLDGVQTLLLPNGFQNSLQWLTVYRMILSVFYYLHPHPHTLSTIIILLYYLCWCFLCENDFIWCVQNINKTWESWDHHPIPVNKVMLPRDYKKLAICVVFPSHYVWVGLDFCNSGCDSNIIHITVPLQFLCQISRALTFHYAWTTFSRSTSGLDNTNRLPTFQPHHWYTRLSNG